MGRRAPWLCERGCDREDDRVKDRGARHSERVRAFGMVPASDRSCGSLATAGGSDAPRTNVVAPDIIDTPANRDATPGADTSTWRTPEEIAGGSGFLRGPTGAVANGAAYTLAKN